MSDKRLVDFHKTWNDRTKTIILFAGVFDPIHKGHISAAKKALYYGSKVVFLPERVPQHKHGATEYKHRLEMIRLAIQDEPELDVLDYPNDHHRIKETFLWLRKEFPSLPIVWLIGQDVESIVTDWDGVDQLQNYGVEKLIVIGREHESTVFLKDLHGVPVIHTHRELQRDYDISSRRFRKDPSKFSSDIPETVLAYIRENDLYSALK